jgi:hypothetical protein
MEVVSFHPVVCRRAAALVVDDREVDQVVVEAVWPSVVVVDFPDSDTPIRRSCRHTILAFLRRTSVHIVRSHEASLWDRLSAGD